MSSWAATIERTEAGLRLRFARPTWGLDMTPEKARELAASLLVAAEQADQPPAAVGEWDDLWPAFIKAEREQNEPEARRLRDELVLWHEVHGYPTPSWLMPATVSRCTCTVTRHERQEKRACPVHFPQTEQSDG